MQFTRTRKEQAIMRISIALAALVAALALPAGAFAMEATISGTEASTGGTGPANYLTDGKYVPQSVLSTVVAGTSALNTSPYTAVESSSYTSPGSRLRAGEGAGGALNSGNPTTAVGGNDRGGFGGTVSWIGLGIGVLALLGVAFAVMRRRVDHRFPARA
jgi:hypothetical protein